MGKSEQYQAEKGEYRVQGRCEAKLAFIAKYVQDKQQAEKRYAQPEKVGYASCCLQSTRGIFVKFDTDLSAELHYKLLAVVAEDGIRPVVQHVPQCYGQNRSAAISRSQFVFTLPLLAISVLLTAVVPMCNRSTTFLCGSFFQSSSAAIFIVAFHSHGK